MDNGKFNLSVDRQAALSSEPTGNWVKKSGVYFGTINKAIICEAKESQSWGVEIDFTSDDGEQAVVKLWIANKDGAHTYQDKKTGEPKLLPNYNLFQAIFCVLNIGQIIAVKGKESWGYASLTGKKIGFALQRKEQENTYAGATRPTSWKTEIVRVFDYHTKKSLQETETGKEAKAYLAEIMDIPLAGSSVAAPTAPMADKDLPF